MDGKACHPTDPDAREMHCRSRTSFGYNAQAAVDSRNGLIIGADVTQDNNDRKQLAPMVEQVYDNSGSVPETSVADGDYFSGEQLHLAEQLGGTVLVHDNKPLEGQESPYHHTNFTYRSDEDCYVCPQGHKLFFVREQKNRELTYRIYRCDCKQCPERKTCSPGSRGRTIWRSQYQDVIDRNRRHLEQEEKKTLLLRRKSIVELTFAHIKHNEGFRRWRVRGLAKVKAQWLSICIAYNVKKMYRLWRSGAFEFAAINSKNRSYAGGTCTEKGK